MKYPTVENGTAANRQKSIAALLAAGVPPAEAAKLVGVSVSYINVLLKGELFAYEIDQQRAALVNERLSEYSKLVSEQLGPNLATLIAIRDDPATPAAARLRAVEIINASLVPHAKPKGSGVEAKVAISLTAEQKADIKAVAVEADKGDK